LPDDVVPTPHEISAGDDLKTTLYYFRVLSNVFKWSSSTSWSCLSQDMILPLEIHTPEGWSLEVRHNDLRSNLLQQR
jgi:hypothetical protein